MLVISSGQIMLRQGMAVNEVYIIIATNSADFDKSDIIVAGKTREAAEKQLEKVLKDHWANHCTIDDKEFYETEEKWIEAWYSHEYVCGLAE